ncbi:MAG: hypothetical protein WBB39_02395 [Candidatus Saccharimonadales bacterium]
MGLLDSLKKLLKNSKDVGQSIDRVQAQAEDITQKIPGQADDKFVASANQQIDNIQKQYDAVADKLPGQNKQ